MKLAIRLGDRTPASELFDDPGVHLSEIRAPQSALHRLTPSITRPPPK